MRALLPSRAARVKIARINGDRYNFREKIVPVPISGATYSNANAMYRHRGFTLLELTLVTTIIGIIAVAAVPNFSSTDPSGLELAALEVADAMRFARGEALRLAAPRGFQQQSSARRITVMRPDMSTTPATLFDDVYHPTTKKLYDIDFNTAPFVLVNEMATTSSFRGTCNQNENIYFDANGTPWCVDPPTVLLEQLDVTLTRGSLSQIVTLHGITGRVTIQ